MARAGDRVPFIIDPAGRLTLKVERQLRKIAMAALTAGGKSLRHWAKDCHAASLAIVRHPDMPSSARVARGWHPDIVGQHSWVVIGDPYAKAPLIIDATLWSYLDTKPHIVIGHTNPSPRKPGSGHGALFHQPHGYGSIWDFGRPDPKVSGSPRFALTPPKGGWSEEAARFLKKVGKLGLWGWGSLASKFPVGGWPAAEIIRAMYDDDRLNALIPIDQLGMLTDLNPGGLYLRGPDLTEKPRRKRAKALRDELAAPKRKPAKLGDNQLALLKCLVDHGTWHDRSGWHWSGVGTTIRMMNRLVERGLVDATPVNPPRKSYNIAGNPPALLYKINRAGRRALKPGRGL